MNIAGLTTVDHASQVVAEWLNLLQINIGWKDRGRAYPSCAKSCIDP